MIDLAGLLAEQLDAPRDSPQHRGRAILARPQPRDGRVRPPGLPDLEDARAVERQGGHEVAKLDHHPGLERVSGLGPVERQRGGGGRVGRPFDAVLFDLDGVLVDSTASVVNVGTASSPDYRLRLGSDGSKHLA